MSGTLPPLWDYVPIPLRATFYLSKLWGVGYAGMYLEDAEEYVSVVGTNAFMEFVESIQAEGVELERRPMGEGAKSNTPLVIEVDEENRGQEHQRPRYRNSDLNTARLSGIQESGRTGPYTARFYTCDISGF